MPKTPKEVNADATIALGGAVEIALAMLKTLAPIADVDKRYSRNGVILANDRQSVSADGCGFKLSLYIEREPLTDDEKLAVERVAKTRDAKKAEREEAEQKQSEREKRAAFELGQSSTLGIMARAGELAAGAAALAALSSKK